MNLSNLPSDVNSNITTYLSKSDALNFCLGSKVIRQSILGNLVREHRAFFKGDGVDGSTRLMRAACERTVHWPMIRFIVSLIGKRAVLVQDTSGETAIHLAVRAENLEVIQLLCEKGGKDAVMLTNTLGNSALYDAVNMEDMDIIRVLSEFGGRELVMLQNNMGLTAMHKAVEFGNIEITHFLCTIGGKEAASLQNNDGDTPLAVAKDYFHADITVLLDSLQV
mmetsp:Transcript_11036/g.13051  ORF Transcript_11036/g.13051 Transcript_11036/m.13051 type:complete len:223 (+) Transcript_11036:102-770(+)